MKELKINNEFQGMRLDRFCSYFLKNASKMSVQKMIRTKKIKVNGKKEEASYRLNLEDKVFFYVKDELFSNNESIKNDSKLSLKILYEDDNIIAIDKPKGVLSQGAKNNDESVVSFLQSYFKKQGIFENNSSFKVGVVNRLDTNTSGVILSGKSRKALMLLNDLSRKNLITKKYYALVSGEFNQNKTIVNYAYKDEKENKLIILENKKDKCFKVETKYTLLSSNKNYSLVEATLITGKFHQIRAQLSFLGFPIVGDSKYGDVNVNKEFKQGVNLKSQFLHAFYLALPSINVEEILTKEIIIKSPLPNELKKALEFAKIKLK